MTNDTAALTVFFDGACPLCSKEMQHIRKLDQQEQIALFDLAASDANQRLALEYPDINLDEAMAILHAKTRDGQVLKGLDVTHAVWSQVGLGYLTAPLRWSALRPLTDRGYRFFARHRSRISALATGRFREFLSPCSACQLPNQR